MANVREIAADAFAQAGLADHEELSAKAEAVVLIRREMNERQLNQSQYAELIGWKQPNLSALLSGDLDRFSVARINDALRPAGAAIAIHYCIQTIPAAAE